MAQVLFNSDSTPAQSDLDANFTELYNKTAWATTGIGYATGSGGAVTQATNKSTGVTLNTTNGQITMNGAALAASAVATFVMSNSRIGATDCVVINVVNGGTVDPSKYRVWGAVSSGACSINVKNRSAGSLSDAVVLNFAVVKVVTS